MDGEPFFMTLPQKPSQPKKNSNPPNVATNIPQTILSAETAIPQLQQNFVVQGQHTYAVMPRQNTKSNQVADYLNLVERVARAEFRRIPPHMVEIEELISIGALAVQNLINNKSPEDMARLNVSYMATAIRWGIRNEIRVRLKWYTLKHKKENDSTEETHNGIESVREAVYETILSIDSLQTSEDGTTSFDCIADDAATPEEELEISELGKAVKRAIKSLPAREKYIMECRFYKNMQVKDIADEMGLSSSRITRIVQSCLENVRQYLKDKMYIQE
jgi:RNA polymerase sigma factor (sigma-70 family)